MFEYKPDFEQVMDRYEAWWDCEILDRPLVSIAFAKPPEERRPAPETQHATVRERWMDTEYLVARTVARMANSVQYADALPVAYPNLGPEVFSAYYGCPMVYGERTAWSEPILADWSDDAVAALRLDEENFYFRKTLEMTDALLEAGRGKFIVGYTDLHGGADAIAAFRDPQQLCIDMLEHPRQVEALCDRITGEFLHAYDVFHERLAAAGMPSTTWLPATCRGKFHVPSNDFSCMISDEMFEATFLPGLIRECEHMDRCMYHLDGPGALRYLDRLLAVPSIHAIQWVPGAGSGRWRDSLEVYRRIQQAGKAFCIGLPAGDLDELFGLLRPEGAWLQLGGIADRSSADAALKAITRWGGRAGNT